MTDKPRNRLPELVDLAARIKRAENGVDSKLSLELTVGVYEHEDEFGNPIAKIGTRRAMVVLDLDGLEIPPGSKGFEQIRSGTVFTDSGKVENSKTTGYELGSEGESSALNPINMQAGAKAHHSTVITKTTAHEYEQKTEHQNVRALGNNRWEVSEPDGKILQGTYIRDCDDICAVAPVSGANRGAVGVSVHVKQRDLVVIKEAGWLKNLGLNRERIINVVLAKALHNENRGDYRGVVVISDAEVDHES